ncbi:hypothetical protein BY996DRAFT_6450339 [Phakopsora pachyrhizi]|nr:hypothetical protein BY996DRAFT_6450339 [Phakopsora pachyrhizi]
MFQIGQESEPIEQAWVYEGWEDLNETELLRKQTSDLPNPHQIELNNINLICKTLDLTIVEISTDGHCLFSAINGIESDEEQQGLFFINHMISLSNISDKNRLMTNEKLFEYCDYFARTAEVAGKPEIMALSRHYIITIHVIQAAGPILKFSKTDQYFSKQNRNKNQDE